MYILIIILCITIFFRDKKEGFLKRVKKASKRAFDRARRCARILVEHRDVLRDRDRWKRRLLDFENGSVYKDSSFGNNVFFSYFKDDMNLQNRNI